MTKGPKLQWKPMDSFPGEYEANVGDIQFSVESFVVAEQLSNGYEANVGDIQFSVATEGQWDICARGPGGHKLIIIDSGDSKNLASAKRKCQQWLDRQWRAMNKLKEKQQ